MEQKYIIENKEVYWLCEKFIDSTEGVGLPLGNQVSQVFALLYLSVLDHFITGELGVKYYGRYMDDFYLIVQDREYAKWCLHAIYYFVYTLGLELNEKTQIIPFKNGVKFCGFHTYVTPDGKVIRKLKNENKRADKKKFKKMVGLVKCGKLSKEKFYESYNAWKNHISHGNCVKLRYEMDKYIEELFEKWQGNTSFKEENGGTKNGKYYRKNEINYSNYQNCLRALAEYDKNLAEYLEKEGKIW